MELLVGYIGFSAAALAYLGLAIYYLLRGRWGGHGPYLLAASLLTAAWAAVSLLGHDVIPRYPGTALALRHLAMLAWVWLLWHIVASHGPYRRNYPRRLRVAWVLIGVFSLAAVSLIAVQLVLMERSAQPSIAVGLCISIIGLSLTETLYRGFHAEERWGIKFLCLATGGLFVYDTFLYGEGFLFQALDPAYLEARGLAQALVVPFFAINIRRSEARHFALGLSRRLVFGSTVVFGAGLYLSLMAGSAYYVRVAGGAWGSAVQNVFLFAAVLLLAVALLSGTFRARLRRFLSHHVLSDKYDYRAEWLRFTDRLAQSGTSETFDRRILRALADIVDSPAGALWDLGETHLPIAAGWNLSPASLVDLEVKALAGYFAEQDQVIEISQAAPFPEDAPAACHELAEALRRIPDAWVLVPLCHQGRLIALLLLTRSRSGEPLSPEDSELLQIASRQAAGYLSEQRAARALAEVREFEKFNQRYAFVTHDIKNLVSQLSLMLRNAEKHGGRQEFQADMLETVQSAVGRMNHLMERLKDDPGPNEVEAVAVKPLIEKLSEEHKINGVDVRIECPASLAALRVRADARRVDAILRHLFQNALEAAGDQGSIVIGLRRDRNFAVIEVRDSGQGMDLDFIRSELFRPFRSTKHGGMGIGAFQCRAYARELGGDLEAISSVGAGTTMRVTLPMLREA